MRSARGDHAVQLAKCMQRSMLALIGSHRRRTYAHDIVYGTYQLYKLFGKPWNAATEGNEHAHQDMKKFFHDLTCHNPRNEHCDAYEVLRLSVVKTHLLQNRSLLLAQNKYAAMRANRVMAEDAACKAGKKRGAESGPKGLKMFEMDTQKQTTRQKCSEYVRERLVDVHMGCACACEAQCGDCSPD